MVKVVINVEYGGFQLSKKAMDYIRTNALEYGLDFDQVSTETKVKFGEFPRHSQFYVDVVEELGEDASKYKSLKVYEIKGNKYKVFEYDGAEVVVTPQDGDYLTVE